MTRPTEQRIADAIARARGSAPPPPDRAILAELESVSRRLATVEARLQILTPLVAVTAAATGLPVLTAAAQALIK